MLEYDTFTEAYVDLIKRVYQRPEHVCSPRGMKIHEYLGVTFKICDARNRLPYVPERNFSIAYFIGESLWYLSGNNSTEWISRYSSFWKNISDDGSTANSAYGSRIFKPHDRIAATVDNTWTQWKYVIDELINDQDSRRVVIHIRSPQDSLLAKKDVPCTLTLQFFLRQDRVHQTVCMRSSDLIFGIAYDVPAFTLFQELLAVELTQRLGRKIDVGTYTHTSNSLHLYERDFKMASSIIANNTNRCIATRSMPRIESLPDLEGLYQFEERVSTITDVDELIREASGLIGSSIWDDWKRIIIAHRVRRVSDPPAFRRVIDRCWFEGYRFFEK